CCSEPNARLPRSLKTTDKCLDLRTPALVGVRRFWIDQCLRSPIPPKGDCMNTNTEATTYLGGNCEFGTGVARLAVGAWAVNPMTAQLMSTPAAPYGAAPPVAGLKPVSRSGRVAARLKTTTSSICRVLSPACTALLVHKPSCASHNGL